MRRPAPVVVRHRAQKQAPQQAPQQAPTGFALLGVLWIIIGLSVLALAMARVTWHAMAVAEAEHDQTVGRWLAEGCLARLRSVTNNALASTPTQASSIWRVLDTVLLVDSAAALTGCDVTLRTDGRIVLDRASVADLDTLSGMTTEAIARIVQMQQAHTPITDLILIESALSPSAKALFDASYSDLRRRTTVEPDAWVVRAHTDVGTPPTPVNVEARLVRAGSRVAVMRWIEW